MIANFAMGYGNVKTANVSIFIAVVICGLIAGRAELHAQPIKAPDVSGGDNLPWNRGIPPEKREEAKALFLEGNRLFMVPAFARAAEKYSAALSKWKHPAFYFNLALAQLGLGQDVEAHESLRVSMQYGADPLGAEPFQEARKQLQELERQLGRIRITCPTKGAEVTMDGATLFTGPGSYEGWVNAKSHEITAKKPNYLAEARRVTVSSGETRTLDLKLITLVEATDTGRRWATWKPWAVVAAGVVVAAGSGVLHAQSSRDFTAYDDSFLQLSCATMPDPSAPGCTPNEVTPEMTTQLNRARLEQQIAVGGYIAGGALIATGAMLVYMNRPQLIEQSTNTKTISIIPTVSNDMFGIAVSVSR